MKLSITNAMILRNEICEIYEKLKVDKIDIKKASEMNNTAGKILGTINAQLKYAKLCNTSPDIEFLDCN